MKHADAKADMKTIRSAVGKHERNMHPGAQPTKLRAGGKTNSDMLKMGRGLAKIANQKAKG